MVDRLSEFKRGAAEVNPDDVAIDMEHDAGTGLKNMILTDYLHLPKTSFCSHEIVIAPSALNADGAFMQEFFGHVEYVKRNIIVIRDATTRVGEINQQVHDLLRRLTPNFKHILKIWTRELTDGINTLKKTGCSGYNQRTRAG